MTKDKILKRVQLIADDFLIVDGESIECGMELEDIEGWTSFAHVNIMLLIEKDFDIRFSTTEISSIGTIKELINLISSHPPRPGPGLISICSRAT